MRNPLTLKDVDISSQANLNTTLNMHNIPKYSKNVPSLTYADRDVKIQAKIGSIMAREYDSLQAEKNG